MWSVARLLFAALALAALAGCGGRAKSDSGKPRVVATFSVLGDVVHHVAGDRVELTTLVGGDGDVHTFEPTPQDAAALAEASLVVENGAGLEPWLDRLYRSSGSKGRRVAAVAGLDLIEGGCCKDHQHDHDHDADVDPHVWHDVANVLRLTDKVRDALAELDPAGADEYRERAAAYRGQLEELDRWVKEQVATLPAGRRKLVTNHDTFGYFARRYGFEVAGTALASFSTEAADPSAADFAKLVAAVRAARVPAVFTENVHNPRLMERLARETGVKLAPPLFTDALGPAGGPGDTYVKMMRHNVSVLVGSLKP